MTPTERTDLQALRRKMQNYLEECLQHDMKYCAESARRTIANIDRRLNNDKAGA